MIRTNINITSHTLVNMFMFEPKDNICLKQLERLAKDRCPGNYRFINFVDPDVTQGDSIFLITADFETEEDRVLFTMTWEWA